MSRSFDQSLPSDITLLLRADAERCWLDREVTPVLRQVESCQELPEEQLGAALAYLEAIWGEATVRARETDAAHAHLTARSAGHGSLSRSADRYHAVVRALRGDLAERVTPFMETPVEFEHAHAPRVRRETLRVKDTRGEKRRPSTGGCTPRAA